MTGDQDNWRQKQKEDVRVGVIVEDCRLHIGPVIEVDYELHEVLIESMFDGGKRYCGLYHCGVTPQTPEQIEQKMKLFQEGGMAAIIDLWEKRVAEGTY